MPADKAKRTRKTPPAPETSGEAFRALFEHSPDPIYIHDLEGRILEANRTASETMGYSLAEFRKLRVTDVDEKQSAAKVPERIKKVLAKTGAIFESVHKKRDGAVFPVEVNARPISYMGRPAIISTVRNIAQRKADEERQARLAAIIENTNDAIIGLGLDDKVNAWNKGAERTFGYTEAEILGKPITILSPDPIKADGPALLEKIHRGMHLDHVETKRRRKDGRIIDVSLTMSPLRDHDGKMIGVSGAAHDITARKQAETALRKSQETLSKILDQSPMCMAIVAMDGTIEYINKKCIATFGYLPEDVPIMERWWVQAYPDENYRREATARWMGYIEKAIAENREIEGDEYTVTCKDGSLKTMFVFGVVVAGKVLAMFQDITDRKKAEEKIRELNLKLEQRVHERTLELQTEIAERKRTEEALRASETKYRLLFDNIDDTILVHDARGNFFDINRGGLSRLGYSKDEVLGMNLKDFDAPEAAARIPENMAKLFKTGHAVFESTQLRKDGGGVPVEVNAMTFELDGKTAILSVSRDITARKKAEATLHEQLSILEAYHGLISLVDMDGLHTYINPAGARMLGYNSPADIIGKTRISDAHTPEDLKCVMEMGIPAALKNGSWNGENRLLRPDGSLLPVDQTIFVIRDEKGRPHHMGAIMTDLSARKKAEAALRESESKYRLLVEGTNDVVYSVAADGVLTYIGPQVSRYGWRPEELIGQSFLQIIAEEDRERVAADFAETLRCGREMVTEFRSHTKSGEVIWFSENGKTNRDSLGNISGTTGILLDVTTRKQAEERITKLNEDLKITVSEMEAANRELEAFTYSVSHDLRTPLRHMISFAKLLSDEAGGIIKGQPRHYLTVVSDSAKKMDKLITSLLAFSKLARTTPEINVFSGRELAEEAAADVREDCADREIEWKTGEIPVIRGDRFMLKQVFLNLLSNAVKYSSGRAQARIEVFARSKGNETIIGVRDNGIGFDMKHYGQLFGVFQRLHTDKEFEGTGVGLANVKSVISKHGGRVWAESAPDKGTTFYFSLPAAGGGIT